MKVNRESRISALAISVALLLPLLYLLVLGPMHFFTVLDYLPVDVLLIYEPLETACEKTQLTKGVYYRYIAWWQTWAWYRMNGDDEFPAW